MRYSALFPVRVRPRALFAPVLPGLLALAASAHAAGVPAPVYVMQVPVPGMRAEAPAAPATPAAVLAFQSADGSVLSSLAFPDTPVGSNSAPLPVTLKNTGNAELTFNSPPAFTAAPFSVAGSTCSGVLAAGASCSLSVVFSPAAQQSFSGVLTTDTSIAAKTLPLSGTGTLIGVRQLVAGENHTFVQKTDGSWAAAGYNGAGQLGLGDTANRARFATVPALSGATRVLTGASHTLAQLAGGSWVGTGAGDRLGLGDTSNRTSFTAVPALAGASEVVVGGTFTFAKLSNGVWASTGNNWYGQLGLGDTQGRAVFTAVPALAGATQVQAGAQQAFAAASNGQWLATGENAYGQLGLGDTVNRLSFTPVSALTGAVQLKVGALNTFARFSNGAWMAAGNNAVGQLGLGDAANRTSFTTIAALAGASQVVNSSANYTMAKLANGAWAATGYNHVGQLGLGDTAQRTSFTAAPALAGASDVLTGGNHTFARFANGDWAAVGSNGYGQMGLGDTANRTSWTVLTP